MKSMIGCDECFGWFHYNCVKITIGEAKRKTKYLCPKCTKKFNPKQKNDVKTEVFKYYEFLSDDAEENNQTQILAKRINNINLCKKNKPKTEKEIFLNFPFHLYRFKLKNVETIENSE
ncbi:hypothetical protein MHBO_002696, partial [Bonamia ostreae]